LRSASVMTILTAIVLLAGVSILLWLSRAQAETPVETVPQWASIFTPADYRDFIHSVQAYFIERGISVVIENGYVIQKGAKGPIEKARWGLQNIAQTCHLTPRSEWKKQIAGYFDTLAQAGVEGADLEKGESDFSKISGLLAVKIWPRDYLTKPDVDKKLVYREDLEGTITVLVYDMPNAIRSVNPKQVDAWQKSRDELFALGLKNVRAKSHVEITEVDGGYGLKILALSSDQDFFVASHVLFLEQHPQCIGRYGTIVGIPTSHILMCYPIENADVAGVMKTLIPTVNRLSVNGPGSISGYLYWRHDGRYTHLPYKLTNKAVTFEPPDEFVDLLNRLLASTDKK
jgi:hypothetical protein